MYVYIIINYYVCMCFITKGKLVKQAQSVKELITLHTDHIHVVTKPIR